MDLPLTLNLEQQFNLKIYQDQIRHMSQDQAQEALLEVMRQIMIKDNVIRHLMKSGIAI
jgi:Phycobilisome degradation protein nblA